jgi:paraquat-inducible protein B
MNKPPNKTLIGAFVVAGIALAAGSVVALGSGHFSNANPKVYVYFNSSVKGLQIGSPVMFRGVKIGEVRNIALELNAQDLSVLVPIEIELNPKSFSVVGATPGVGPSLPALIQRGLRAQLQLASVVTGQLTVYLDFVPGAPAKMNGPSDARYPEIPTIPSDIEQLQQRLEALPIKDILAKLDASLTGIDRIANSPNIEGGMVAARKLITDIDRQVTRNENLGFQTGQTLEEVSKLTRSMNAFVDYLSLHPEALLRGRHESKGESK